MPDMRLLGVLLCYNDGDLLPESLEYLLGQQHDLVVWDHGSTDDTASVLARYRRELLEVRTIPREFDFYQLYPAMSRHLLEHYVTRYDWISWPDQDEFLEGPDRQRSYAKWLVEVCDAGYDWIEFNNFNFWFTERDDPSVHRVTERVRHYALHSHCAPRIRSWRASATNVRLFNHNPPYGRAWPGRFNLRHYPMRSPAQARQRLAVDRAGLRRGKQNIHYDRMAVEPDVAHVAASRLHRDDGVSPLNADLVFDWRDVYGRPSGIGRTIVSRVMKWWSVQNGE
jgi:glycosyltransferase involved in cell wall biosynthesis